MILFFLIFSLQLFSFDEYPDTITQNDLEFMKVFEKKAYLETLENFGIDETKICIIDFVTKFAYVPKHNKLKINLNANSGFKNYTGIDNDNKTYYAISINVAYPLLDKKEENEYQKEKLNFLNETIKLATEYLKIDTEIKILIKELEFLRLKDRRLKVRVHAGIQNLSERINLFENIIKVKANIADKKIKILQLKKLLILRVIPSKREELRKML
jgi:hypothetical protein